MYWADGVLSKLHGKTKSKSIRSGDLVSSRGARCSAPFSTYWPVPKSKNLLKACAITLNFVGDFEEIEALTSCLSRQQTHSIIQNNLATSKINLNSEQKKSNLTKTKNKNRQRKVLPMKLQSTSINTTTSTILSINSRVFHFFTIFEIENAWGRIWWSFWRWFRICNFYFAMTSFWGCSTRSKLWQSTISGISRISVTVRDSASRLVSKCAEGSISYTLSIQLLSVSWTEKKLLANNTFIMQFWFSTYKGIMAFAVITHKT